MTVGSLFAGIGGIDLGLERAGMRVVWQVEIDPACQKVLERYWPGVRRYGDVRTIEPSDLEPVDLVAGGFPCQDVSVAGRRAGLAGQQSGLFFEFVRIVAALRPTWVLIENVPGLLSSNRGRDMGTVLLALAKLGYGYAYRVLDAQYFGLAQRRKRVFIVGHLGAPWSAPAAVLFEPESLPGDPPPRRAKGQTVATLVASGAGTNRPAGIASETDFLVVSPPAAGTIGGGSSRRGWVDDFDRSGAFVVSRALTAKMERLDPTAETLVFNWQSGGDVRLGIGHKLGALHASQVPAVAVASTLPGDRRIRSDGNADNLVMLGLGVRRLTPLECERLQGFPDGWTAGHSDSARYRMLGNAVAVPVAEWIGRRILELERQREVVMP